MKTSTPFKERLALQMLTKRGILNATGSKGFTLIELLVVIVILGVLGAVGYQAYVNQIGRANASTAANTATALAKNCSALRVTTDQTAFATAATGAVDTNTVSINAPSACGDPGDANTFSVTIGTAANARTAIASVLANGQVTPASLPTS